MKKTKFLISVEGNIASGKSTVIEYLKKKISESYANKEAARNIDVSPVKIKKQKIDSVNKVALVDKSHYHLNNELNAPPHSVLASVINIEKSSFFTQSDVNLKLITEPVELWRNLNGHNLLDLMYKDPKRWAFAFHSYVQLTMLQNHIQLSNNSNHSLNQLEDNSPSYSVNIMERSIFSSKYCFIENMYKSNLFREIEYEVLDKWFNWMIENHDCSLDIIFYLRTNPETCLKRLNQRAREEETKVSIDYLKKIHDFHEEWLTESDSLGESSRKFYRPPSIVVIDANKKLDQVYEIIENVTKNVILQLANN